MVSEEMRRTATDRLKILEDPLNMETALILYTTGPMSYTNIVESLMNIRSSGHAPYLDHCHTKDDFYVATSGALGDLDSLMIVDDLPQTEESAFFLTLKGYEIIKFLVE